MPRLEFRHYNNLSAIRLVPKALFVRLLLPYAAVCKARGLDVAALKEDDASNEALWTFFTGAGPDLDHKLLDALHRIDDLSDEAGHDLIVRIALRERIALPVRDDADPRELAITVYLDLRSVFDQCHDRRYISRIENFREYAGKANKRLPIPSDRVLRSMERRCGAYFEKARRSSFCRIRAYQEGHLIQFLISHGRPFRTDESVENTAGQLRESMVAYRPQKHDLVAYDNRAYRLKINAAEQATMAFYQKLFGEVLFGDADFFMGDGAVTLLPLRERGEASILPIPGIEEVFLSEVWVKVEDEQQTFFTIGGKDSFASIASIQPDTLNLGELVYAKLLVRYEGGGRARKLEIKPPNQVIFDHKRHDALTREFLEVRQFLSPPSSDPPVDVVPLPFDDEDEQPSGSGHEDGHATGEDDSWTDSSDS